MGLPRLWGSVYREQGGLVMGWYKNQMARHLAHKELQAEKAIARKAEQAEQIEAHIIAVAEKKARKMNKWADGFERTSYLQHRAWGSDYAYARLTWEKEVNALIARGWEVVKWDGFSHNQKNAVSFTRLRIKTEVLGSRHGFS